MSNYNSVTLIGNLGKAAEVKETKAGHVARFSIAVYKSGKGKDAVSTWETIIAWHGLAKGMADIPKGTKLVVVGTMETRSYEVEGSKRFVTELQAKFIGRDISVKEDDDTEDPF